jgi:hypothetical protein
MISVVRYKLPDQEVKGINRRRIEYIKFKEKECVLKTK